MRRRHAGREAGLKMIERHLGATGLATHGRPSGGTSAPVP
jgi:hypothetical protein